MAATTTEIVRPRRAPLLALALAAIVTLGLSGCGASDSAGRLAYADSAPSDETVGGPVTEAAAPPVDASAALAAALDQLGTGYHFEAAMTTAGGGQVSIDGYRLGEAMTFELQVADLTIETVARDGRLWTRVAGDDEWASNLWNADADPMAPLRTPVQVTAGGNDDSMVAVYEAASLGLGIDETVTVDVTAADGEVRFATSSDRVAMVSVLRVDDSLPAIVAPS